MKYVKKILKVCVPVIIITLAGCGNSSYINDTGFSAGLGTGTDIPLFDTLTVSDSAQETEYSEAEVPDSLYTISPFDSLYSVIESLNENQSYLLFKIDSLEAELSYYGSMTMVNEDFEIPRKYSFAGYEVDLSSDRAYDKLQKIFKNEIKAASRYIPRSGEYFPYFDKVFKEYEIPEDIKYLSIAESGLNPNATSHAGAAGIWQFMPKTAKGFGLNITDYIDERRDIFKSTEAAAKLLKTNHSELLKNGIDDWLLAMCAYNAGIGNVLRDVKSQGADCFFKVIMRAEETDYYVYRSIAIKLIFENQNEIFGKKFDLEKPLFEKYREVKVVSKGYHELKDWAKAQGTTLAEVYEINPWIKISKFRRAKYTPLNKVIIPPGEFKILVPAGSVPDADLVEKVSKTLLKKTSSPIDNYIVRKGDSLGKIAKAHGMSVAELKAMNNLRSDKILIGQKLIVSRNSVSENLYSGSADIYTVKSGDTLSGIAREFGTSINKIKTDNDLYSDNLMIGQKLKIFR